MRKVKIISVLICSIFICVADQTFSQIDPENNYAQDVFDKLVKTINQNSIPKPHMNIEPDPDLVAQTFPNGQINVGVKLIEQCRKFGKDSSNAIAHILSHELTHYYQNHFWAENFGTSYASSNWGKLIGNTAGTLEMMKTYETQADQYGMYYSFSAGYQTLDISEQVLDSVYKWFHLPDQLRGYPSLRERRVIAELSKDKISSLIPAFEAGNLLLSVAQIYSGDEQAALAELSTYFFEDIADRQIKTKELNNNMAIGKTIAALQYYTGDYKLIKFPFMLESHSMLYDVSGSRASNEATALGYNEAFEEQVISLLGDAELNLLAAIKMDKTFYPAYINLAIVYVLRQKYGSAQDELKAAMKYMTDNHPQLWAIFEMQGIIGHLQFESELSDNLFSAAVAHGSTTANYNVVALRNENYAAINEMIFFSTDTTEQMNGIEVFDYLNKLSVNKLGRYNLKNESAVLFMDTLPDYIAFNIKPAPDGKFSKLKFLVIRPGSVAVTSKGLHMGDSIADLEKLYGDQHTTLAEAEQNIFVFQKQNLMVWVKNGVVEKWSYWWV